MDEDEIDEVEVDEVDDSDSYCICDQCGDVFRMSELEAYFTMLLCPGCLAEEIDMEE